MPQVAHLTHIICFPCTEGRFGKGGLVNHLQPTTTLDSSIDRQRKRSAGTSKDLDHSSMEHNLRYFSSLIWIYIFERAALRSPPGGGDAETKRMHKDSLIVNLILTHISYSFTSFATLSCQDFQNQQDAVNKMLQAIQCNITACR